jgi:hypothetical protein
MVHCPSSIRVADASPSRKLERNLGKNVVTIQLTLITEVSIGAKLVEADPLKYRAWSKNKRSRFCQTKQRRKANIFL